MGVRAVSLPAAKLSSTEPGRSRTTYPARLMPRDLALQAEHQARARQRRADIGEHIGEVARDRALQAHLISGHDLELELLAGQAGGHGHLHHALFDVLRVGLQGEHHACGLAWVDLVGGQLGRDELVDLAAEAHVEGDLDALHLGLAERVHVGGLEQVEHAQARQRADLRDAVARKALVDHALGP